MMRRVTLSLVAGLSLLALPALAQTGYETDKSNLQPATEERTSPDTGSVAPGSGLTLTGEVVSWNDKQLVVKTTTGVEHIQLETTTSRPATFMAGDRVVVDYVRTSSNGVMIARQIRPLGSAEGTTATTTTTGTMTTGTVGESQLEQDVEEAVDEVGDAADRVGAELSEIDDEVEEEIEEAVGSSIDNDGAIGNDEDPSNDTDASALPATGSNDPLIGLLGLLALGTAAGLRRL